MAAAAPTPPTGPAPNVPAPNVRGRDRRTVVVIAVVAILLAIVVAGAAVYLVFFAFPAPAAPTLDDALRVLLPTASPR